MKRDKERKETRKRERESKGKHNQTSKPMSLRLLLQHSRCGSLYVALTFSLSLSLSLPLLLSVSVSPSRTHYCREAAAVCNCLFIINTVNSNHSLDTKMRKHSEQASSKNI